MEYVQNSLVSAASDISLMLAATGYKPPHFDHQEEAASGPSVREHLRHCRRVWRQAHEALLRSSLFSLQQANKPCIPTPHYRPGQRVSLSLKADWVEGRKLAPRFVGPFEVECLVNPAAVRLKLLALIKVRHTFMGHGSGTPADTIWRILEAVGVEAGCTAQESAFGSLNQGTKVDVLTHWQPAEPLGTDDLF